ncbi:MAG TPA: sigma-70 family RNA polymerase sigma factor [Bacteroidales bacterium]|nr:sigma-70 family RNA polymerase sigma factor [Bacteroidales bacterium]
MDNQIIISDQELIDSYLSGNHASIEKLIRRHKRKVFTYICLNVKNKHLAEDLFQDTFIKVINTLRQGSYNDEGKFLPWVMRIAHNLIIDYFRKSNRIPTIENNDEYDIFNTIKIFDECVEERLITEQIHKDVKKLIDLLPDDQKEVIVMRHFGDMSFKEIAEQTNVSINTALGRMRYALINLRRLIKEKDIILSA